MAPQIECMEQRGGGAGWAPSCTENECGVAIPRETLFYISEEGVGLLASEVPGRRADCIIVARGGGDSLKVMLVELKSLRKMAALAGARLGSFIESLADKLRSASRAALQLIKHDCSRVELHAVIAMPVSHLEGTARSRLHRLASMLLQGVGRVFCREPLAASVVIYDCVYGFEYRRLPCRG